MLQSTRLQRHPMSSGESGHVAIRQTPAVRRSRALVRFVDPTIMRSFYRQFPIDNNLTICRAAYPEQLGASEPHSGARPGRTSHLKRRIPGLGQIVDCSATELRPTLRRQNFTSSIGGGGQVNANSRSASDLPLAESTVREFCPRHIAEVAPIPSLVPGLCGKQPGDLRWRRTVASHAGAICEKP